jgi:aldose 1-epimerase
MNDDMTSSVSTVALPTGTQYEIMGDTRFGRMVATLTQVGASLRALTVDGLDIVQRYPLGAPPSLGAGIVMSPWPNRIDGGRWTYRGEPQQLSITDTDFGNASHGLLMSSPYSLVEHDDSSITLGATIFAHPGYPFVIETSVRYAVTPDGLETTHRFTNLGALPAPVAVGSHGYYRIGDVPTEELMLRSSAATVYPNDERMLPGPAEPVSGDFDLRTGGLVGEVVLDHCFTDQQLVDGRYPTRLTAPDGRYVEVWADASFDHIVLLTTRRFTDDNGERILAVAIEPQTAAVNSLNTGIGTTWLAHGETFTARWGVTAMLNPVGD